MQKWSIPEGWVQITTIDSHTEGEPARVIISGLPEIKGSNILERRRYIKEHYDHLRTALMWEPRGNADMYGIIVTSPVTPEADFGVLFLHNEGFSTMCGHGIIAIAKVVLETGMFPSIIPITCLKIDTPAGLVTAYARVKDGHVTSVYFHNVPSYVDSLDESVDVPGMGKVHYDLAFGGAYYAYVNAADVDLSCTPEFYRALIEKGMAIKRAIMQQRTIRHPFDPELSFLYGTIFIGSASDSTHYSRNVCIFAEGEVDRSPTGTGVSGRLAIHFARGEIGLNQPITIESIIGSTFTGEVVNTAQFGSYPAIIPQVEGRAWITGRHEFCLDPADPFQHGFILR